MLHAVLTIRRSSIAELRAEEHGLVEMNMATAQPGEPVAIDWEFYSRAESDGAVDVLAVWGIRALVGYCVLMHFVHPQSGVRMATSCGLYVRPGADAGFGLRRLIDAAGEIGRAGGGQRFSVEAAIGSPLGRMLPRLGFRARTVNYEKVL